jgi:hypothetical protein
MGKLYGQRPTPANVNVPAGSPGSGEFPGIPGLNPGQSGQYPAKPASLPDSDSDTD